MTYDEARPSIKSGDLLAWTHRSWKSWYDIKIQIVRFFTQSEYSHVGLAWVIGERVLVLEAVVPKVRIYPLSALGSFYRIPDFIKWTPETEAKALSLVGTDYSQVEALAAFFDKTVNESMQCAKFVSTVAGIENPNRTPSDVVYGALIAGGELEYVTNTEPVVK